MSPASVSIFTNEKTRQPASACRSTMRKIFMELPPRTALEEARTHWPQCCDSNTCFARATLLKVMRHRPAAALLHRQPRLGAVKGLDLAHMGICGSRCSDQDYIENFQGLSPF